MSTRCHIQIKTDAGFYPCMIYKHSDGYPEGVLPFLQAFTTRFAAQRGNDYEYFIAQCLRQWAIEQHLKEENDEFYKKSPEYRTNNLLTGWGVCLQSKPHGDIDYIYTVDLADKSVTYKQI